MKETKKDETLREALGPGRLSRDGYLGGETRSVEEIIETDRTVLDRAGMAVEDLVRGMKNLRNEGRKGLGEEVRIEPGYRVRVETERGLLVCPFGDSRSVAKTLTTVKDERSGRTAAYTDMNIHLIERHGFFEGRGSAFRIEPEEIAALLKQERKPS